MNRDVQSFFGCHVQKYGQRIREVYSILLEMLKIEYSEMVRHCHHEDS